ncbi:MAG: hypothetical protein M1821_000258 [Bathelium mastoideum]|nr:MAG: hypothetical protein M1821_000258 [Bathelium mastoideum]
MVLFKCFLTFTIAALPHFSDACLGHALLQKRQLGGFNITYGDSTPQPPETVGYNLNHLAIIVPNLTATLDFYINALGFRELFTVPLNDDYSFTYLSYPQGGRNGTGYQTAQEMTREKNNSEGLLEILYSASDSNITAPGTSNGVGFSHLGFLVPSVVDTQARLEKFGAKIIKRAGEPFTEDIARHYFGLPASLSPQQILAEVGALLDPFLLAVDSSGYLLEIQQQDP